MALIDEHIGSAMRSLLSDLDKLGMKKYPKPAPRKIAIVEVKGTLVDAVVIGYNKMKYETRSQEKPVNSVCTTCKKPRQRGLCLGECWLKHPPLDIVRMIDVHKKDVRRLR